MVVEGRHRQINRSFRDRRGAAKDLSEIKVKTLDEIKKEKQQKLQAEKAAKQQLQNGEETASCSTRSAPVALHGETSPSSSVTSPRQSHGMKLNLKIPLMNLPTNSVRVIGTKKEQALVPTAQEHPQLHTRSRATNSFSSLVTDDLLDEDLEPYDEEESIDEENLLREDNTTPRFDSPDPGADIVPTNSSTPFPISNDQAVEVMNSAENQHVSKDEYDNESSSVDYSDVPLGSSHDADELDEIISLHPMSTEFDEENEDDKLWHSKGTRYPRFPSSMQNDHTDLRGIIERSKQLPKQHRSEANTTETAEDSGRIVTEDTHPFGDLTDDTRDDSRKERSWLQEKNTRARTNARSAINERSTSNDSQQQRNTRPQNRQKSFSSKQKRDSKANRQHQFGTHNEGWNRNIGTGLLPMPLSSPFSSSDSSLSKSLQQLQEIQRAKEALVKNNPLLPLAVQILTNQGGPLTVNPMQSLQDSERHDFAQPYPPGEHRHPNSDGSMKTQRFDRPGGHDARMGPRGTEPGPMDGRRSSIRGMRPGPGIGRRGARLGPMDGPGIEPNRWIPGLVDGQQGVNSRPAGAPQVGPGPMGGRLMMQDPVNDSQIGPQPMGPGAMGNRGMGPGAMNNQTIIPGRMNGPRMELGPMDGPSMGPGPMDGPRMGPGLMDRPRMGPGPMDGRGMGPRPMDGQRMGPRPMDGRGMGPGPMDGQRMGPGPMDGRGIGPGPMDGRRMGLGPMDGRRIGPGPMDDPRMGPGPMDDPQMGQGPMDDPRMAPGPRERNYKVGPRNRQGDAEPCAVDEGRQGDRRGPSDQKHGSETWDHDDAKRKAGWRTRSQTRSENANGKSQSYTGKYLNKVSGDVHVSGEKAVRPLADKLEKNMGIKVHSEYEKKNEQTAESQPVNVEMEDRIASHSNIAVAEKANEETLGSLQSRNTEVNATMNNKFDIKAQNSKNSEMMAASTSKLTSKEPSLKLGKRGNNIESCVVESRNIVVTNQHGGKRQVVANQEGIPFPVPVKPEKSLVDIFLEGELLPKGFCYSQLEKGCCMKRGCRFRHISEEDVAEYQRIKKLKLSNAPRETAGRDAPTKEVAHSLARKEQAEADIKRTVFQNKCETIRSLLANGNLAGAMQLMERLDRMQETPGLTLIERCLSLCSQKTSDQDTNAQVAMKAFNLIGKVREKYNRHDFTTLIECLCNSGQYIMAYQKLGAMKQSGHSATLDVFVNLIKSSKDDPKWAFHLLDEIRRTELFKPEICSELIRLGSTSKTPVVNEMMDLFQVMLQSSIMPSQEDFNSLIKMLCDNGQWNHLCTVLCSYSKDPLQIPVQAIQGAITSAGKKVEWTEGIINLLGRLLKQSTIEISVEAWQILLTSACHEQYPRVEHIHFVLGWMEKCNVPCSPQSYCMAIAAFTRRSMMGPAMTVFEQMTRNAGALQDPSVYASSIQALCKALESSGELAKLLMVLHFMMEHAIKPDADTLRIAVDVLVEEKNIRGIHQLYRQCRNINVVPPVAVYRKIVSALEKFEENPEAAAEAYLSFRKAYPVIPDELKDSGSETSSSSSRPTKPPTPLCWYLNTPRGCLKGDRCGFLHPNGVTQSPRQELCKYVDKPGGCLKGDKCCFLHPNGFASGAATNQTVKQGEAGGTSLNNPFVLKGVQGGFGQLSSPFAQSPPPVLTEQQFGQGVRRTRSADCPLAAYPGPVDQPQQLIVPNVKSTNSAPVSLPVTVHGTSGFQFPDKQNSQFYIPKIQFAGTRQQWGEIAKIYTELKSAGVPMEQDVISNICAALTDNCTGNADVIFTEFLSKLQGCLEDVNPQRRFASPGAAFEEQDKLLVGHIGISMMQLCHSNLAFTEGYTVLHKLHECRVLYSQPDKGFGSVVQLSTAGVALLAADICLKVVPAQNEGAVVVLNDANYLNSEEHLLTSEEVSQRTYVFQSLITNFLGERNYSRALELLRKMGNRDAFGLEQRVVLYNDLLRSLVEDGSLDFAMDVFTDMERNFIPRDSDVHRALVNGFGETGRLPQAKGLFLSGCDSGVYSSTSLDPWVLIIQTSLTALETQFSIEQHLNVLHEKVLENAGRNWYNDEVCNSLKIVLRAETATGSFSGGIEDRRMADQMREMIQEILYKLNPPIICEPKGERFEEIVLPRNTLRRWFMANPVTGRHRPLTSLRSARDSSGENDLRQLISHPYLQPGMVDPFTKTQTSSESECDRDEGRIVGIVVGGSSSQNVIGQRQVGGSFTNDVDNERARNERKDLRDRVAHTICGRLTRYFRNGTIPTKDEFKRHARSLTEQFVGTKQFQDFPRLLAGYETDTRLQIVQFVDDFFAEWNV